MSAADSDAKSAERPGAHGRRLLRAAILNLSLLIATLGLLEVLLRVADPRELRDGYGAGYTVVHRFDPELGWLPIPNSAAAFTDRRAVTVRHNSLGLRDIEFERTDRPTVLFMGDSFTWGYDVEAEERFSDIMRAQLPDITIVNAGVSGYGTDQEYLLLNRLWSKIRPDVVVLIFCATNDRDDNSANMRHGGYHKPYLVQTASGDWQFRGQPVPKSRHSYMAENPLVKHSWLVRLGVTAYLHVRYQEVTVPDPTEQLIKMMKGYVESRGAKFFVGLQDEVGTGSHFKLRSFLQDQKITFTSFEGANAYTGSVPHWTPKGHTLVAARLTELLGRGRRRFIAEGRVRFTRAPMIRRARER